MADVMKKKKKGFLKTVFNFGEHIGNTFVLQLFFILYTLKGGIILGIFPSIAAIYKYFIKLFTDQGTVISIRKIFIETWNSKFAVSNKVGYTLLAGFGFLYFDLRVNESVIRSSLLHTLLLVCIFLLGFITVYTFTVMVGHNLSYEQTIKQAFYVSLSTPVFTIAALLGLMLSYEIIKFLPFLGIFFGTPLLILPIIWFTFNGLKKIDELKQEEQKNG
ncbi:DUF624 domain-containing protein [Marinilactibacillus sp. XAAS-LB27]|uniref:YesL family protein n=1 Tax=Marinilactibacillus sp. XAAS-LB27 TaxID=3114538 RepID=UPI002E186062|nr:DUF624 domain-containing protein [Marinilactibacillus sp. XAAS-LB27]